MVGFSSRGLFGGGGFNAMPTSREYRQFARKCIRWAAEATTDEARNSFLDLAQDWTFAALVFDRVEKQESNLHAPTPMLEARCLNANGLGTNLDQARSVGGWTQRPLPKSLRLSRSPASGNSAGL
jgi:hypothetical protein